MAVTWSWIFRIQLRPDPFLMPIENAAVL